MPRVSPKLTAEAYPSIFPNLPAYLSSELPKKRKTPDDRQAELDVRDHQALSEWIMNDDIPSFDTFRSEVCNHVGQDSKWIITRSDVCVCLFIIESVNIPKLLQFLVMIKCGML